MSHNDNHKTRANKRMLEGVVLGGLCSVIAMDMAEVTFHLLDPFAKRCYKYFVPTEALASTPVAAQVHVMSELSPSTTSLAPADTVDKMNVDKTNVDKEKEKKKTHRNLMKRVIRIILLLLAVYLVASYVVR
jgi:hypothetical protein